MCLVDKGQDSLYSICPAGLLGCCNRFNVVSLGTRGDCCLWLDCDAMGASPVVSPSVTFPVLELQVHSVPGLELGLTLHRSSYRGSLRSLAYPIHEWSPVLCSGCRYLILPAGTNPLASSMSVARHGSALIRYRWPLAHCRPECSSSPDKTSIPTSRKLFCDALTLSIASSIAQSRS